MKKLLCFTLTLLLIFSIAGCSNKQTSETDMSLDDMVEVIQLSQQELPELTHIAAADADFTTWLSDYYFMQPEQVADGVICYADGVEASEIAVLVMADEKDCQEAEEDLKEYIQNRAGVFEGYAPQQAAMVKAGIVVVNGRYIALLICPEPQAAEKAFLDCFGENAEKTEPSINSYDAKAVLQAYQSGDASSLTEINRRILDAAKDVIASKISDDMSDYEKELAIHDFITDWSKFDYSVFGRSSADGFTDGSDTPYGVLIDQSAMCHGYSSTFQLFMDMLDIECMTVFGIPRSNGVEHSWNMVKLDGEWYCVDCAWDDPIGGSPCHTYFNVTSDYLRRGSIHRWDETSVPEATGTAYSYGS